MSKNIQFDISSLVRTLNQEQLGMLIDTMIDLYVETYGLEDINFEQEKPEVPNYSLENTTSVKEYLKKFQL
jgi:hypothetical protein